MKLKKQILQKDLQNHDPSKLYVLLDNVVPKNVLARKNKAHAWQPGYNEKYDIIVISKDGTIGDIYFINNLKIALPSTPKLTSQDKKEDQYWKPTHYPKELKRIQSIFQWYDAPPNFKDKWINYIETEFERRENGHWFLNNGSPTYVTGTHYMYLQWTKIDVGLPDFREANRIFYIYWKAPLFLNLLIR